mgnify:CR=1 FL=1
MKITDVRQEYFRWEKSRPITNGMHTYTHCGLAVITVETDQENYRIRPFPVRYWA